MEELDDYAKGAQFGYSLAWVEAKHIADRLGAEGVIKACSPERRIGVQPRKDGPCSLFCFDCGEWVANTANYEMQREGMFSHSHFCADGMPEHEET